MVAYQETDMPPSARTPVTAPRTTAHKKPRAATHNAGRPDRSQTTQGAYHDMTHDDKPAPQPEPAVAPNKSVTHDYIVCLEDGTKHKMLKRHLMSAFGLTPDQYRQRWGLPKDYPMVAPAYSKVRSALAKKAGLGTKRMRRGRGGR